MIKGDSQKYYNGIQICVQLGVKTASLRIVHYSQSAEPVGLTSVLVPYDSTPITVADWVIVDI